MTFGLDPNTSPLVVIDVNSGVQAFLSDQWSVVVEPEGRPVNLLPTPEQSFRLSQEFTKAGDDLITCIAAVANEALDLSWRRESAAIAFGPFVRAYVESYCVRVEILNRAVSVLGGSPILISGVPALAWITPDTSKKFTEMARTSVSFNRQLYAMIAIDQGLRMSSPDGRIDMPEREGFPGASRRGKVTLGLPKCRKVTDSCDHVHCASNLFRRADGLFLWLRSTGGFYADPPPSETSAEVAVNPELRARVFDQYKPDRIVWHLWRPLKTLLPVSLLERLPEAVDRARLRSSPRSFVGPIPSTDVEHVQLAEYSQKGTRIYLCQHGGFYGETVPKPSEIHERSVSTEFLTWGWIDGIHTRPLPSPRLSRGVGRIGLGRLRRLLRRGPGWILWVTQDQWPLDCRLPPVATGVQRYVDSCRDFLAALDEATTKRVLIRYRSAKYGVVGGTERQPQRKALSGLAEAPCLPIDALLARADLVVIDRAFTTTFLECLSRGIPVIVFDSDSLPYVRNAVRYVYSALAAVDIVHASPERAAKTVMATNGDARNWWLEPKRQRAVRLASTTLARVGPAYFSTWVSFLRQARHPLDTHQRTYRGT